MFNKKRSTIASNHMNRKQFLLGTGALASALFSQWCRKEKEKEKEKPHTIKAA